jgi:GNAT superfamily N-acetyltransferase
VSQPPAARQNAAHRSGASLGAFYAWWRGDPWPPLVSVDGFQVESSDDDVRLSTDARTTEAEVERRFLAGHRVYIARMGTVPVAHGWLATQQAAVGELGVRLRLQAGARYLWDFATAPAWRGRGFYPLLLHTIMTRELDAGQFWIGHEQDNRASQRGILKAGFGPVGVLRRGADGKPAFVALGPRDRARVGAQLLGVPLAEDQPFSAGPGA